LLLLGVIGLVAGPLPAAEEEPNEGLIQMIVDLVSENDRDMRALGLQQVREEVPGEAATKRFAELLTKLPPDAQAGLLEALGDRQDAAARPAVLDMLKSQEEAVRAAALGALGSLGSTGDVPLLAEKAAGGANLEKDAARQSLIRLRGDGVNAAILAAADGAEPNVRVALLGVLAARNAKEALPQVLASAGDSEPAVRLAALEALRFLADESNTAAMVKILKAAQDDAQRSKAELALLAVCSRGRQKCAEAIIAGLEDADVPSRMALLRALARAGGSQAMETVAGCLNDEDELVRDEAVRMLSAWPDPAVVPHLREIAKTSGSLRHQVLAIRGLVRLASPQEDRPADLAVLAEVMSLAKRPEEKRLALGVLGGVATAESLALVVPALDDPAVADEAALAAVMIAETMKEKPKDKVQAAMEQVLESVKSRRIGGRAQKVLESL
jgi:HEAT repeat protein